MHFQIIFQVLCLKILIAQYRCQANLTAFNGNYTHNIVSSAEFRNYNGLIAPKAVVSEVNASVDNGKADETNTNNIYSANGSNDQKIYELSKMYHTTTYSTPTLATYNGNTQNINFWPAASENSISALLSPSYIPVQPPPNSFLSKNTIKKIVPSNIFFYSASTFSPNSQRFTMPYQSELQISPNASSSFHFQMPSIKSVPCESEQKVTEQTESNTLTNLYNSFSTHNYLNYNNVKLTTETPHYTTSSIQQSSLVKMDEISGSTLPAQFSPQQLRTPNDAINYLNAMKPLSFDSSKLGEAKTAAWNMFNVSSTLDNIIRRVLSPLQKRHTDSEGNHRFSYLQKDGDMIVAIQQGKVHRDQGNIRRNQKHLPERIPIGSKRDLHDFLNRPQPKTRSFSDLIQLYKKRFL